MKIIVSASKETGSCHTFYFDVTIIFTLNLFLGKSPANFPMYNWPQVRDFI